MNVAEKLLEANKKALISYFGLGQFWWGIQRDRWCNRHWSQ